MEVVGKSRELIKKELDQYFTPFREAAEKLGEELKAIKVTDETQTALMLQSKPFAEGLKKARLDVTKKHKELKADALLTGQTLDEIKRTLLALIEPLEAEAYANVNFLQIQEDNRKAKLAKDRYAILFPLIGNQVSTLALGDMTETVFQAMVTGYKAEKERRDKEEEDRNNREANLQKENQKLQSKVEKLTTAAEGDPFKTVIKTKGKTDREIMLEWGEYIKNLTPPPNMTGKYLKLKDDVVKLLSKINDHVIKNA